MFDNDNEWIHRGLRVLCAMGIICIPPEMHWPISCVILFAISIYINATTSRNGSIWYLMRKFGHTRKLKCASFDWQRFVGHGRQLVCRENCTCIPENRKKRPPAYSIKNQMHACICACIIPFVVYRLLVDSTAVPRSTATRLRSVP